MSAEVEILARERGSRKRGKYRNTTLISRSPSRFPPLSSRIQQSYTPSLLKATLPGFTLFSNLATEYSHISIRPPDLSPLQGLWPPRVT
ncbi:unnamed protein product [Boreogadus saida]